MEHFCLKYRRVVAVFCQMAMVLVAPNARALTPLKCSQAFTSFTLETRPFEIPEKYELPEGRNSTKYVEFKEKIADLRKNIIGLVGSKLNQIEAAIYPAAGFDAAYPFLLLPKVKVVIGLDDKPFVSKRLFGMNSKLKAVQPFGSANYVHGEDVEAKAQRTPMGHQIAANIKAIDKNIRILSVEAFKIVGEKTFELGNRGEQVPIHGLVRFDRGEGTPEQIYIHVHRFFSSMEESAPSVQDSWWSRFIPPRRLALLYKGNVGIQGEPILDNLEQILINTPGSMYVASVHEGIERYRTKNNTYVPIEDAKRGDKEVRLPYFQKRGIKKLKLRGYLGYSGEHNPDWIDVILIPE